MHDADDLDALVTELNAGPPRRVTGEHTARLRAWLERLVERSAGETGHLVLSSLHTTDVATTVGRIADSFPLERQNTIRQELAMSLAAVMVQTLLPKVGGGLTPAAELLMVGYGAR